MPNKYLSDPEFAAALQTLQPRSATLKTPNQSPTGKKQHVLISTPTMSGFKVNYMQSLMETIGACQQRGVGMSLSMMDGCSLIGAARNNLARKCLSNPYATHMLMIDDDIGWQSADIFRMLDSGYDFVVGAVPMRRINLDELKWFLKNGGKVEDAGKHVAQYNVNADNSGGHITLDKQNFFEVSYAGTAFMLVSKAALQRMVKECGAETYVEDGEETHDLFGCIVDKEKRQLNGEDVSFCKRWTGIGGRIMCLADCQFSHAGQVVVDGKFLDVIGGESETSVVPSER